MEDHRLISAAAARDMNTAAAAAACCRPRAQLRAAQVLDGAADGPHQAGNAEGRHAAHLRQQARLPLPEGRAGQQGLPAAVRHRAEGEAPDEGIWGHWPHQAVAGPL